MHRKVVEGGMTVARRRRPTPSKRRGNRNLSISFFAAAAREQLLLAWLGQVSGQDGKI